MKRNGVRGKVYSRWLEGKYRTAMARSGAQKWQIRVAVTDLADFDNMFGKVKVSFREDTELKAEFATTIRFN